MNRYYFFLLFLVASMLNASTLQAQLDPGDIMFVGFMGDGNGEDVNGFPDANCEDGFAFAALVDIPANTTIFFTEGEYTGGSFSMAEGDVSWSHSEVVPAGTIIRIITHAQSDPCAPVTATLGTAQYAAGSPGDWALSATNEEIFAYLGSLRNPTVWLSAFISDNSNGANGLPPELIGFVIDFTTLDPDVDLAVLSDQVDCGNKTECLAFITDLSNWNTEDASGAGDCCNGAGVEYPEDLPTSLQSCETPVINGINVVDCSQGANGTIVLAVDGGLNGGAQWEWTSPPMGNDTLNCEEQSVAFQGDEITISFDEPSYTHYVRASGGCLDEPLCFAYVPNDLLGAASFSLSTPTFCSNDGLQTGLGGGMPVGGVYSGPGVTDDGNGMTFTFDPSVGGGTYSVSYTVNNICNSTAEATIDVNGVDAGIVTTMSGDPEVTVCLGDNVSDTLNFSSSGSEGEFFTYILTDGGNSILEFSETGVIDFTGYPEGSYRVWGLSYSGNITAGLDEDVTMAVLADDCYSLSGSFVAVSLFQVPMVTFTAPGPFTTNDAVQPLTGGMPDGGTYSGPGVTDNNFDPAAVGSGTYTITYTYTDANGCSASATGDITVEEVVLPADNECGGANDISALFGQPTGEPQTSGLFDNTGYNSTGDPANGYECFDDGTLERTTWYTFVGDGNSYQIKTVECNATNYITNGDTQVAIFSGDCSNPVPVACNEDEDFGNQVYNANVELATEDGGNYLIMIDGWSGTNYSAEGEFCIEVTNLTTVSAVDIQKVNIHLFPNPTTGMVYLEGVTAESIEILDNIGRRVNYQLNPGNRLSLDGLPMGLYLLHIITEEGAYSARVMKE